MKRALLLALAVAACRPTPMSRDSNASDSNASNATLSYTLQGPALRFDAPARGAFIARSADDRVSVSGSSRAASVTINGQTVTVDPAGKFQASVVAVPGVNILRASAAGVDAERAFVYGEFTPQNTGDAHAIVTRLNAPAFSNGDGQLDTLSAIATYAIGRVDLFGALANPFVFHYEFVIGSLDLEPTAVTYDGANSSVTLAPLAGGAHTAGVFGKLGIDVALTLHFLGDHQGTGHIDVERADFAADIAATFDNASAGVVARIANLALTLGALQVTTDLPASDVLDAIVNWIANLMRDRVAAVAAEQIESNTANYFALALNSLALPASIDLTPQGVAARIATVWTLDGAAFDAAGVTVSAAPALGWPDGTATAAAAASPGAVRLAADAAPSMPGDSIMAMSLSFDLMNQALYAVWGQGGLDRTLWPGGEKLGVTFAPLTTVAALPPVLTPNSDGTVTLTVGDLALHTRVSVLGFSGDIAVSLSFEAAASLAMSADGSHLGVTLQGKPSIVVDVNSLLGAVPDLAITALERLIEALAPDLAAAIGASVNVPLPSLPLDAIQGFTGHKLALAPPATLTVDRSRVLVRAGFMLVKP